MTTTREPNQSMRGHKLLTAATRKSIPALYSTEDLKIEEKKVAVKFFSIANGWTWYAVEGQATEDGDFMFFGRVDGFESEWGYFLLSELASVTFGPGCPAVERDCYFSGDGDALPEVGA